MTLYQKLQAATNSVNGNISAWMAQEAIVEDAEMELGICQYCFRAVPAVELERNAHICDRCCLK